MILKTTLLLTLLFSLAALAACAQEVSHTESSTPGFFGGRTNKETTVTKNADGSISTESSSQTTR